MFAVLETLKNPQLVFMDIFPKIADMIHKSRVHRQISSESKPFAAIFPFASYFVFLVCLTIPDIFLSISLGVPFIKMALTLDKFIVSLIIWYLVFFSPRDLFHTITSDRIVKTIIGVFCEVNRKNTYSRLSDRALRMVSKSYFSALLIPTIYCLGFSLFVYPVDQLMRGELVLEHEAKHPHFATFIVLTYSVSTCGFLYLRELELPFMSSLGFVTLDHVFKTVMILAIVMSVFKNLIGSDPLTMIIAGFSSMSKCKPNKATKESRKVEMKVSEDEEESVHVESPKKVRATRRRVSRP